MMEQVSRKKLLEVAREFYNGENFEKYIEKESRHKSPIVKYTFDKVVESLEADRPERSYRMAAKEMNNLKRGILRVLKGSYRC